MRFLAETITKALVDNSEAVDITITEGNETIIIEVKVAKEDVGKVIGKKGVIADAFRTILISAGAKRRKRCILQILDT